MGYYSASESSSSESMSGGSSFSKKVGRPPGVYITPVNMKVPESLMNSERAAMPLGFPGALGGQSHCASFGVSSAGFRSGRTTL